MAFRHGNKGRVTNNGTAVKITGWTLDETADEGDTTHSEAGGFKTQIYGNKQLTGSFTGNYDTAAKPTPSFVTGATLTNLILLTDAIAIVTMPLADVSGFRVNSEIRGIINFTCNFKSNGTYTWAS
jgi:hypothetical protein